MLGKQAWRVMTEPQSFIVKLLKARYFPSCSFKEASLGRNPSYVWRSIFAAKDLVSDGSLMKVGRGNTIIVWTDPWIPVFKKMTVSTPVTPGLGAKVCNLLKEEGNEWDHDLVRDIFNSEDATRILNIPLSYTPNDDSWLWLEDEKGKYTVKSGYRLLRKLQQQIPSTSMSFNWLKLWSLPMPPKVKNFIWRALQNCIPTFENLRGKNVEVYPICPVCIEDVESLEHILFSCSFAQHCWQLSKQVIHFALDTTVLQRFHNFFASLNSKELELLCSVAWSIWSHRNGVVWDHRHQSPSRVVNGVSTTIFQWQQAQSKGKKRSWI